MNMTKLNSLIKVAMVATGIAAFSPSAWAETSEVSYQSPVYKTPGNPKSGIDHWETKTVTATVIDSGSDAWPSNERWQLNAGWYYVPSSYDSVGIDCKEAGVNLIIGSEYGSWYIESAEESGKPGISVPSYASLAIYGQKDGEGLLYIAGDGPAAGIGSEEGSESGEITINSGLGTVMANASPRGDGAAGIGGGAQGKSGPITINGSYIMAYGTSGAAAIGGGSGKDCSEITINGGKVLAEPSSDSAGIGGGTNGKGQNITINGGTVTAKCGYGAAGIGGSNGGSAQNITINGGTVTAEGYSGCPGIGSGSGGVAAKAIKVSESLLLKAGATGPTDEIEHTGEEDLAATLQAKRYVAIEPLPIPVSYIDAAGVTQTTNAYLITEPDVALRTTWNKRWYVVTNSVEFPYGVDCSGAVNLILADGASLVTRAKEDFIEQYYYAGLGVTSGSSLTIYGQEGGTGSLSAIGGTGGGAGIGGGDRGAGSNITINGGRVTATGNGGGAGIGGGYTGTGSDIQINGGVVTAMGGNSGGAGIGGGKKSAGSNITINGGKVTANGSNGGAGIGSGSDGGSASEIYVADDLVLKADGNNPPTTEITHDSKTDIATSLAGKQYATAVKPNPTITGVTARQRYPWNGKVDIEYTASDLVAATEGKELVPAIKVLSVDRATTPWTTNYADSSCLFVGPSGKNALTDAEATKDGTHQIVWDMDKQGLSFVSTNVIFAVLGEGKELGGVQLWEDGPYWAECNVGAAQPQDYGYYFWWGDIVGYKRNAANNGWVSVEDGVTAFTFAAGNCGSYQKDNAALKTAGYIDSTTCELKPDHDAATKHLGAPWRMPTDAEMTALKDNCSRIWTGNWNGTGVAGYVVTGKGDYASKSIFLPAAGYGNDSNLASTGSSGSYWSSTPDSGNSSGAQCLGFFSSYFFLGSYYRYYGQSVRPVRGFAK